MKFIYNNPALKVRRQKLRRNQTDAEKIMWSYLRNKQLYGVKFFRQYSVGPYILDFYSPRFSLAIEVDGAQHTETEKREYDKQRSGYLNKRCIHILRFWNNEVLHNIEGVLYKIVAESGINQEQGER